MTTLLLEGGHVLDVKTPAEEVEERLAAASWPTTYSETNPNGSTAYTWVDYTRCYATFEPPTGREPVRVRTDAVLAVLP